MDEVIPDELARKLLEAALLKVKPSDRLTQPAMAKKLLTIMKLPRNSKIGMSAIQDCFPMLHMAGVLDYEQAWMKGGGWGILVWRCGDRNAIADLFSSLPSPKISEAPSSKRLGLKDCCENRRPVRSRKTGLRRCKNCGATLKGKKKR